MNRKVSALWATGVGLVCGYAIVRLVLADTRLIRNDIVQGALVGAGLAIVTVEVLSRLKATRVNGWSTMLGCSARAGGFFGFLERATCTWMFPGPINAPEEAVYWMTQVDGAGRALRGDRRYVLHFPADGLPPNRAFWSLTMGDSGNRFVANPINRYSVSDRSGLVPNPDGSVDVLIQSSAPEGREANWLPAPAGGFGLWLRIYLPEPAVLDGTYAVPPVTEVS